MPGGRETETCASSEGDSAPPSDGDGTIVQNARLKSGERAKTDQFRLTHTISYAAAFYIMTPFIPFFLSVGLYIHWQSNIKSPCENKLNEALYL